MKFGTVVKTILYQTGTTQANLANKLNLKTQSVVAQRLRVRNISLNIMMEMLDELDYEIVIRHRKPPYESYIITKTDRE